MGLSASGLKQILQSGVVELVFTRRHPVSGRPGTRRMLASLDSNILNSDNGRLFFNFSPPAHSPSYNAAAYNLVVAYDIFMQDWRAIPADNTNIIQVLPSKPPEKFWEYYNEVLVKMTGDQKAAFIDK